MPEIAEGSPQDEDVFDFGRLEAAPPTGGDVTIVAGKPGGGIYIQTDAGFLRRLWNLLTTPLVYLFTGVWRL